MEKEKELCPICGKPFINLGSHMKQAHDITKDQLEKETELTDETQGQDIEDLATEDVKKPVHVARHMNYEKNEADKKLKEIEKNRLGAYKAAEKLNGAETVETDIVDVAEMLVRFFGYKNVANLSPNPKKGIMKKTYVVKQK